MFMFLVCFGNKSQCFWKGNCISRVIISPIHTRDWWPAVTSPSASLQHKTFAATDHLCQITLNRRLLCTVYVKLNTFKKWCKFLGHVKANHAKRNCVNWDLPVNKFPIFVKVSYYKMSKLYSCYWYIQLSIVLRCMGAMVHNKSIRMSFIISEPLVRLMIQFCPKILIHIHLIKWGDYSEWLSYVAFSVI
jgi:hypothetical protein